MGVNHQHDGIESVRITGERYIGEKSAYAGTITASGNTLLVAPSAGKRLRVVWVSAIPSPDNANANRVRFKFGSDGDALYESYAVAHWEAFDGLADEAFYINAQTAEAVSVTVHYRELP